MTDNRRPNPARSDAPGTAELVSHESRVAIDYDGMTEHDRDRLLAKMWRRICQIERTVQTNGADLRELGEKVDDVKVSVGDLAHQINLSDRGIY